MNGVLVVGAGLAGTRCAETLRANGYDRPVTVVGAERSDPYERPALSKEILSEERTPEHALLRPPGWWAERSIELRTGETVEAIDAVRHVAVVAGRELGWDHLMLATGARPRLLPGFPPSAHVLSTGRRRQVRAPSSPGRSWVSPCLTRSSRTSGRISSACGSR